MVLLFVHVGREPDIHISVPMITTCMLFTCCWSCVGYDYDKHSWALLTYEYGQLGTLPIWTFISQQCMTPHVFIIIIAYTLVSINM